MQHAHAERCVRVTEAPNPCGPGLDVQVVVRPLAVLVSCWRDAKATAQRPEPDTDQRCANEALAPRGEDVDGRQDVAQENAEQGHDDNAGRMTEPPRPSGDPTPATSVKGKRCNSGEVIRP
jgi:hypothetical protein